MVQLSPSVVTKETDLTTVVTQASSTQGGFAGQFQWGPVEELTLVTSEDDLVSKFWTPNNTNAADWFTAANYLNYTDILYIVRVVDDNNANTLLQAKNATSNSSNTTGFLVKNDSIYLEDYNDGELSITHDTGDWIAKFPGDIGNALKVSVCPSAAAYQSNLTGTMTVSSGSKTVTGSSTLFTTEMIVGDLLVINSEVHRVSSIASNTSLTLDTNHVVGATANTAVRRWEYYAEVNSSPNTSAYVSNLRGSNDEMHIVVVDTDGTLSGVTDSVLEKYQYVSKASDASIANGSSNYYKDVVNSSSSWIRWAGSPSNITNVGKTAKNTTFGTPALPTTYDFSGGNDGAAITNSHKMTGFDFFKSAEDTPDVSLILGSDADTTLSTYLINNIAEVRQDVVVFLSPPRAYVVNNKGSETLDVVNYRDTLPSTSYAALDNNWKYQYDRYNDLYRYVPCNGDVAGIHARSDDTNDPWWAAAGLNRGHMKNVVKLAWNPKLADRDILYSNGINPIVTFKGEGTVLFGQKTMQTKPSAFDRINVRRLFIVLRKSIAKSARYYLFEFNDAVTRQQFKNTIDPFLRDVKGRRGVTDYYILCDETNNTPQVIDTNGFKAAIFIKPARSAEFLELNFVAVGTGVDFTEVVSQV